MGGDGLPGPDRCLGHPRPRIARETERIRLGTLVTSATFRFAGAARHRGGAGRRHERRPRRARPRRRVVRRRAHRLRHSPSRRWASASSASRSSSPSSPGSGPRRSARPSLRRAPLPAEGQPRAAQAGPAAPPAADRRRRRAEAHAAPRRHLRRRVQPPVLVGRRHRGAVRPGARRLRGRAAATRNAAAVGGPGRVLRSRRGRGRAPCRQHRAPARRATRQRRGGHPRRGRRPACRTFADIGAQTAYLQVLDLDDLEHLDLLAAEVLPRVS